MPPSPTAPPTTTSPQGPHSPQQTQQAPVAPAAPLAPQGAVRTVAQLARALPGEGKVDQAQLASVAREFRLRVPAYYLSLIEKPDDAIWRQAVPHPRELEESERVEDFLAEDDPRHSPVPHLTHRYPDRALLLVTSQCPMYCRFCMRKRKTLRGGAVTRATIAQGIAYLAQTPAVREVILSGGDPLVLSDRRLGEILAELRAIPHLEVIRIHTRTPCVEPDRITPKLAALLGRFHPVWLGVHFNHPREVTPKARQALATLAAAGLPLLNQAVLLRGVNDDPHVLADLFQKLLRCGVQPYYLHHSDQVPGTAAHRVSLTEGLAIVGRLRELAPELAMLHYVLDTPGGGGKVPLAPPGENQK